MLVHFIDYCPEQQKITKQLAVIEHQEKAHEATFEEVSERLTDALELVEDCSKIYRLAKDHVNRMMNQAIFSKLWIEEDGHVTAEFAEPFNMIIKPLASALEECRQQKIRGTEVLTDFFHVLSNRIQKFWGCGWSNDFLVQDYGIEPGTLDPDVDLLPDFYDEDEISSAEEFSAPEASPCWRVQFAYANHTEQEIVSFHDLLEERPEELYFELLHFFDTDEAADEGFDAGVYH